MDNHEIVTDYNKGLCHDMALKLSDDVRNAILRVVNILPSGIGSVVITSIVASALTTVLYEVETAADVEGLASEYISLQYKTRRVKALNSIHNFVGGDV
jgi:hypothetical protein